MLALPVRADPPLGDELGAELGEEPPPPPLGEPEEALGEEGPPPLLGEPDEALGEEPEEGLPKLDVGLAPGLPGGGTTLLAGLGGSLMAEPNSAAGSPPDVAGGAGVAFPSAVDAEVQLMRRPMGQVRLKLRSVMVSLCRAASYSAVPVDRLVTPGVLSTEAVCTVPGVVPDEDTACKAQTKCLSPLFCLPNLIFY